MTPEELAAKAASDKAAADAAATAAATTTEEKTFSAEAMHRTRAEAAEARKELAALRAEREAEQSAKLAEDKKWKDLYEGEQKKSEAAAKKVEAAEARARARYAKSELKTAAVAAGLEDLDLLDLIKTDDLAKLEDEDEITEKATDLVKAFKAKKPSFFKTKETKEETKEDTKERKQASKTTAKPNGDAKSDARKFNTNTKEARAEMLKAWDTAGRI